MIEAMKDFAMGFVYAFRGLGLAARGRNMAVHILLALVAISLLAAYSITGARFDVVVVLIGLVIAMETVNTAIEALCNLVSDELHLTNPDPRIRNIKDMSAGAVLIVAIASGIVACFIYLPYLTR